MSPSRQECSPVRRKQPAGFTLVELLVVCAVIAMLVAMMTPALSSAREQTRRAKCSSNMKQIGLAFRLYQDDHSGKYPWSWEGASGNSNNWEARLGYDEVIPGSGIFKSYIPQDWITWNTVTFAKRFKSFFLCPTVVNTLRRRGVSLSDTLNVGHGEWGYCYNSTRADISYTANVWPYFAPQYLGANLDLLYSRPGNYAIMTDGNRASWNSDNDWNAFTPVYADVYDPAVTDWQITPVHGDSVNVLFMDGHVQSMKTASVADRAEFNKAWYGGIPVAANPYIND